MKTPFALTAACAFVIAAPAAAQILGGSLGGGLGGGLGGSLGGVGQIGKTVGGTIGAGGALRVDRSIDRRSGRVDTRASGGAEGRSGIDAATSGLLGSGSASARGDASASGGAGVGIQAIGTDAVGHAVGSVAGSAGSAAGSAAGTLSGSGSASSSARGAGGASFGPLAAAGSAAASAAGALTVAPGMVVRDTSGRAIGRVQDVRATANGLVDTVLVGVGDRVAALPADNFSVAGEALVSAMSRAEVRRQARDQSD